ncbi:MAG TPA: hypothetical protein VFJ43_14285, partial [Bacteroidia bacterium]|nr:hypothetical protein [Bacteroidia bacterium]
MKSLLYFIALFIMGVLINCSRLVKSESNPQLKKTEGITSQPAKTSSNTTFSIVVSNNNPVCSINDEKFVITSNLTKNAEVRPGNFSVPGNNSSDIPLKGKKTSSALNGKPKT